MIIPLNWLVQQLAEALAQALQPILAKALAPIKAQLNEIQGEQRTMATALEDLQAAEASIATDVQNMDAAIQAAIAFIQAHATGVPDADVEAVVTQLTSAHQSLQASASALNAAVNPPAPNP